MGSLALGSEGPVLWFPLVSFAIGWAQPSHGPVWPCLWLVHILCWPRVLQDMGFSGCLHVYSWHCLGMSWFLSHLPIGKLWLLLPYVWLGMCRPWSRLKIGWSVYGLGWPCLSLALCLPLSGLVLPCPGPTICYSVHKLGRLDMSSADRGQGQLWSGMPVGWPLPSSNHDHGLVMWWSGKGHHC